MKHDARGSGLVLVLVGALVLAVGGWGLSKTKFFHGESKRAESSRQTTDDLTAATNAQLAKGAAVFQVIGEANAKAPASKQRDYIARAVPIGMGYLGVAPDPQTVIEQQRLEIAILNGQLELANSIVSSQMGNVTKAKEETARALSAKRASDIALIESAAETRGAEQQAFWFMLIAGSAVVLYIWTKLSHVSPMTLSGAIHDIRKGTAEPNHAIAAIDSATTPFQQMNVAFIHWIRTKLDKVTS